MRVTVVLDGAGLHAWAQRVPPREVLAVMEVLRRHGAGSVLVPSVVTVEALTGKKRDAPVNQILKQVELDEALPLDRTRQAARLRQDTNASAVDAVVAEAAVRAHAAFLITSDPNDMSALLERGGSSTHVVTVYAVPVVTRALPQHTRYDSESWAHVRERVRRVRPDRGPSPLAGRPFDVGSPSGTGRRVDGRPRG